MTETLHVECGYEGRAMYVIGTEECVEVKP